MGTRKIHPQTGSSQFFESWVVCIYDPAAICFLMNVGQETGIVRSMLERFFAMPPAEIREQPPSAAQLIDFSGFAHHDCNSELQKIIHLLHLCTRICCAGGS